jgi:hypothetical protein
MNDFANQFGVLLACAFLSVTLLRGFDSGRPLSAHRAPSRRSNPQARGQCALSGVKRTSQFTNGASVYDPGCVKTLRGITAPGILGYTVTRRAKKPKNLSSARHYDQIRFRFYTTKTHRDSHRPPKRLSPSGVVGYGGRPKGAAHEAARFHHARRYRGSCLATRGARAGGGERCQRAMRSNFGSP